MVPGLFDDAITYDGTNRYVQVNNFPAGSYPELTVETWVNWGTKQGRNVLVNEQSSDSLWMNLDTNGADRFNVYLGDTTNKGYHSTDIAIPRGEWTHLAFTYSDAADELKLYVDGQLRTTATTSGLVNLDSGLTIGTREDLAASFFDGTLDELAFYSRALSGDEILARFGAGPPVAHAPEPAGLLLALAGGLCLVLLRRRRK